MAKKKPTKFKESVGIDIGTHSIKLVHLKRLHDGYKLLNYEIRPTVPAGVEYIPSDLRRDRYAPILAEILRTLKIKPRKIKHLVTSIGGDHVSIKQIKTIFLPEDELESALFFEAKKHLPISGSDMLLDFQVLNVEERTNNMNILLVATTKEELKKHNDILTAADIAPGIVDAEPLAVANSFMLNAFVEEGVYVIVNMGAHRSNMIIYGPKAKFFSRDLAWGGYNITKDIMKRKNLSFEDAENHKFEHGITETGDTAGEGIGLSTLEISDKPTEEQIALEIKRSLRYYVKEAGNSDFRKVLLVGGSSKLKGLPEYFTEQLNIPTEIFNPFINLEMPEKLRDKKDPQLALAIGLAMRAE
ncbi:MAG: pilus assembly protein PilM [Candidatus Cloacimonetes bacterium]|nr:pilus assembly protein PilM [Candidatus Cloacimonadota bacterium]